MMVKREASKTKSINSKEIDEFLAESKEVRKELKELFFL